MNQGQGSPQNHEREAREILASGETPEVRAKMEAAASKLRSERSTELHKLPPRIAWWLFVGAITVLWFFEITSFSWWWRSGGMIVGIIFGLVLAPFFPLIALFEGSPGRALVGLVLLVFAAAALTRARPETAQWFAFLRRYFRR